MDLRLTIELVPSSAWGNNLRDLMAKEAWDSMRRQVYKQYKYHCGICNAGNTTMYCHEIWQYDDETWTQKLTGFIALCKMCHHCKHLGHANILAQKGELDYEQVVQHFIRVNQCSREDFEAYRAQAFDLWRERSEGPWDLDLGDYAYLVPTEHEPESHAEQKPLWETPPGSL